MLKNIQLQKLEKPEVRIEVQRAVAIEMIHRLVWHHWCKVIGFRILETIAHCKWLQVLTRLIKPDSPEVCFSHTQIQNFHKSKSPADCYHLPLNREAQMGHITEKVTFFPLQVLSTDMCRQQDTDTDVA